MTWIRSNCKMKSGTFHSEPIPRGFLARRAWAEARIAEGYRQVRCPCCGLWTLWVKRRRR